ncbi:MAG TPA: CRISPR-associated ring nuclease Crn3/Csx3 [Patescibacteria group bacterium]|nr:CRISPR-associated ring nuclease Crn3/Csx3 [Patescibacteria group bacterium]
MARPTITVTDTGNVRLVKFEIPGGVTNPEEFSSAVSDVASQLPGEKPVLLNGRGPVWGYAMLVHCAHPTPAVATFDPRLGYIVVASHNEAFAVGSVIPDPEK